MSPYAPAALRADTCPEAEELAAYLDGRLTPAERTSVERHLARCADCRDVVGESVEALEAFPAVPKPTPWKWVAIAGGALAAAAAIALAVRLAQPVPYYVPEMAELIRVNAPTRAIEGRLSGGFRYAPPPIVTRGAGDRPDLEFAAAAGQVRGEIGSRSGSAAEAARGVTFLLSGDPVAAVAALERATTFPGASAQMWSDLSAAYLARGQTGDAERAAASAQRAIDADPNLLEARYNRALALEREGGDAARDAWREYIARERDADWVAEAQRHVSR